MQLQKTVKAVLVDKVSKRKAATQFNISRATLQCYINECKIDVGLNWSFGTKLTYSNLVYDFYDSNE